MSASAEALPSPGGVARVATEAAAIALVCAPSGVIRSRQTIDSAFDVELERVTTLFDVVDRAGRAKVERFLAAIGEHGAASGWTLNCSIDGRLVEVLFSAVHVAAGYLIVGAVEPKALDGLLLRSLFGAGRDRERAGEGGEGRRPSSVRAVAGVDPFAEITRINSELADLHRSLARKNTALQALNEEKNRILGIAAHELRTPMSVILTYSEFLANEASDALGEEHREFLSTIERSSRFVVRVVDDLLDVAAIEAGGLALDLRATSIVELVRANAGLHATLAGKHGVDVIFVCDGEPTPIVVDADKIDQVLNNLIGNALKFSPRGGTIGVELSQDAERTRIRVCDEGPGLGAADREALFLPFSRAATASASSSSSGAGLGLAIVRRIVEGHGGTVAFEAETGRGATVRVVLPNAGPSSSKVGRRPRG